MQYFKWVVAVGLLAGAANAGEVAGSTGAAKVHYFDDEKTVWLDPPPFYARGAKMTPPVGDPRTGPHTFMLKAPAGYTVKPHTHAQDEVAVVISGWMIGGEGGVVNLDGGELLGPGDWVHIPANVPHWLWVKSDCELVRISYGPASFTYVNPADDPSGQSPGPAAIPEKK